MDGLPDFENDIFISYAHIDNEPLTRGQQRWVDEFHYALETRLNQLIGGKARIWRDEKLQGNDYLSETISASFRRRQFWFQSFLQLTSIPNGA